MVDCDLNPDGPILQGAGNGGGWFTPPHLLSPLPPTPIVWPPSPLSSWPIPGVAASWGWQVTALLSMADSLAWYPVLKHPVGNATGGGGGQGAWLCILPLASPWLPNLPGNRLETVPPRVARVVLGTSKHRDAGLPSKAGIPSCQPALVCGAAARWPCLSQGQAWFSGGWGGG